MSNEGYPRYDGIIDVRVEVDATKKTFNFETVKSLDNKFITGLSFNGRARFDAKGNPTIGTTAASAAVNCWIYLAQPSQRRPIEALPLTMLDSFQQANGVFPLPELQIAWNDSSLVNYNSATDFAAGQVLVLTVFYVNAKSSKR